MIVYIPETIESYTSARCKFATINREPFRHVVEAFSGIDTKESSNARRDQSVGHWPAPQGGSSHRATRSVC